MLIQKGYKVARIEQTETPDMMTERVKNSKESFCLLLLSIDCENVHDRCLKQLVFYCQREKMMARTWHVDYIYINFVSSKIYFNIILIPFEWNFQIVIDTESGVILHWYKNVLTILPYCTDTENVYTIFAHIYCKNWS